MNLEPTGINGFLTSYLPIGRSLSLQPVFHLLNCYTPSGTRSIVPIKGEPDGRSGGLRNSTHSFIYVLQMREKLKSMTQLAQTSILRTVERILKHL